MSKRKELEQKVKHHLKDMEKRGWLPQEINKVTKGKSVTQLAWSQTTYDKFMNSKNHMMTIKRDHKKEITKLHNKLKNEIKRQQKEVNKETLNEMRANQHDREILNKNRQDGYTLPHLPQFTTGIDKLNIYELRDLWTNIYKSPSIKEIAIEDNKAKASNFIDNYFKQISLHNQYIERLENLKYVFEDDKKLYGEFVEMLISDEFKGYINSDEQMAIGVMDVDDLTSTMVNRLEKIETFIRIKQNAKQQVLDKQKQN